MGKKCKRGLADAAASRKQRPPPNNPFELKITREKRAVLGKRNRRQALGRPGHSRDAAHKKRKETLLEEYRSRHKTNAFIDKRIGESNPSMTPEEKMLARFAAERKLHYNRRNIFNLNEDEEEREELTHRGQSLSAIEKYDDPRSDSEDDNDNLTAEFVKDAHFGGGFLKRKEDLEPGHPDKVKSRKDMLDDLIAESKKRKYESQHEREETLELTDKLDEDWKTIRSLMSVTAKRPGPVSASDSITELKAKLLKSNPTESSVVVTDHTDDYDSLVHQLKFDMRAKAVDRLKTPEEIAKAEKDKLVKLESERLLRQAQPVKKAYHQSADALEAEDSGEEEQPFEVRYKDGKIIGLDYSTLKTSQRTATDGTESSETSDSEEDESSDESQRSHSDNEQQSDEEPEAAPHQHVPDITQAENEGKQNGSLNEEELPYTFNAPSSYAELKDLLHPWSCANQITVIDRIIKCHHPALEEGNGKKMKRLLALLLSYTVDVIRCGGVCSFDTDTCTQFITLVKPFLVTLLNFDVESSRQSALRLLQKQQATFEASCAGKPSYPEPAELLLLNLLSDLFPVADSTVTTPMLRFLSLILTKCYVRTTSDVVRSLYLCNVAYKLVTSTKEVVPAAITHLTGILSLISSPDPRESNHLPNTFKDAENQPPALLRLQKDCRGKAAELLDFTQMWDVPVDSHQFRLSALWTCLHYMERLADLHTSSQSYVKLFTGNRILCWTLKSDPIQYARLPQQLQCLLDSLYVKLGQAAPVTSSAPRPAGLRLLEPRIENRFDGRKRRNGGREFQEKQKLLHKVKREMKGAIREIRRDNQFLAREQLKERLLKDDQRKQKVKQLYQDLASQQGDYNAIQRKKKKAK